MPKKEIINNGNLQVKLPKELKADFAEAINKEGMGLDMSTKVRILIKEYIEKQKQS